MTVNKKLLRVFFILDSLTDIIILYLLSGNILLPIFLFIFSIIWSFSYLGHLIRSNIYNRICRDIIENFIHYDTIKEIEEFIRKDKSLKIKNISIKIIKSNSPLAYTNNNFNIYISDNLFSILNKRQVMSVVLHELGHIKNRDSSKLTYIYSKNILMTLFIFYYLGFIFTLFSLLSLTLSLYIFNKASLVRELRSDYFVKTYGYGKDLLEVLYSYQDDYNIKFESTHIEPNIYYINLINRISNLEKK